jgi:hypothetical protein
MMQVLWAIIPLPPAMHLPEGNYTVHIPPEAISVSSEADYPIRARFEGEEQINNSRLYRLTIVNQTLYALTKDEVCPYVTGQTVHADIDLKRVQLYDNETCVMDKLRMDNMLQGRLSKRKVTEERVNEKGKTVTVNGIAIDISIGEYTFTCPDALGTKLLGGGFGKKLFETDLQFHFTPYDVRVAESGIPATVQQILDYGTEKFAKCAVNGAEVIVCAPELTEGSNVFLQLDAEKLTVFDPVREIFF